MPQQLLSEINREDRERRLRAKQYESLQGDLVRLRERVARFEKESAGYDCSVLEQISELVAKLSPDLKTASRGSLGLSISGGLGGRAVIMQAVDAVLGDTR